MLDMNTKLVACAFASVALGLTSLTGCASPSVDAPDVEAPGVVDANTGFIGGAICNAHVGAIIRELKLIVTDEAGTSTVDNIVTSERGDFHVSASIGRNTVTISAPGFTKTVVADVVAGRTTVIDDGSPCR